MKAARESQNKLYVKIGLVYLLCQSAWLQVMLPAESDKGWLLHAARMNLEGRRLYKDIIEVNPPLVVWLYQLPEWISMHTPWLADFEALGIIGLLLTGLVLWVCARLIRQHPAFAGDARMRMQFNVLLALIFIFYSSQMYFFDRDHIFLVLTFPYMLCLMPGLEEQKRSLRMRCLIGSLAAFGYCIKPHTVIVFTLLQLYVFFKKRSLVALFNLENCFIAGGFALYVLSIAYVSPDYFHAIVPMAVATYSEFGNKGSGWFYLTPIVISIGLIFADFRAWYVTPLHRDIYYFMWLCLVFFIYALAQNGWGYTYNPLYCIVLLATGWMYWEFTWLSREQLERGQTAQKFALGIRSCYISFALPGLYMLAYVFILGLQASNLRSPCGDRDKKDCWQQGPYAQYFYQHDIHSFGTISLDFTNWVNLMRLTGATWATRFNHLWMVPKLVKGDAQFKAKYAWIKNFVGTAYAEDLNNRRPAAMLVDSSPGFLGKKPPLDFLGFLNAVPQFKEAWSHYRLATTIEMCDAWKDSGMIPSECRYDVYTRIP